MTVHSKFIVFEGIDGSGKRTQLELLSAELTKRGIDHERIDFPQYQGFFGRLVASYLNGEFGPLGAVDPHFSALLYAGDRLEAKTKLETALHSGKILLADRYVASNLAHQGARVPEAKRTEFMQWLAELEYDIYGLPREDAVVYLQASVAQSQALIEKKGARGYTARAKDLHEADVAHLTAALEVYSELAKQPYWTTVQCFDPATDHIRGREAIFCDVWTQLESKLFADENSAEMRPDPRRHAQNH